LLCHTALAGSRPHPRHLTEFYFWIALGGVLSGIFAVVVAPLMFRTVFEYPLLVAVVVFFRPRPDSSLGWNRADWVYPSLIGVALIVAWTIFRSSASADTKGMTSVFVISGSFVIIYGFRERWFRFSLATAIFIVGSALILPSYIEEGQRLAVVRDFFGVKKVLFDASTNTRKLLHGDTLHGMESLDPEKAGEPLSYYHAAGPAGDMMAMLNDRTDQHVGVIGLGTGSLAAYAGPQRHITFYDLDPQVPALAREYFSFLKKCGTFCDVIVADGRLAITQAKDGEFDLLVVDAFNSDSIPPHLVSREAIAIYVSRLKPNGVLLFHVSNRYLDIEKLVAAALLDSGLPAFVRRDEGDAASGRSGSNYVAGARRVEDLGSISSGDKWLPVTMKPDILPWTDDYSNVLSVVRWF
jgi:spermidine synthase